jgi:hypothetical protein
LTAAIILKRLALIFLVIGLISLLASALYNSYVIAFIGLGLTLWGSLLLLIMPTKYVKLELLTAASSSLLANIEEMLRVAEFSSKGIYLPPKLLPDYQSSLVFVPANGQETLPRREEIERANTPKVSIGLLLTPIGLALSRFFEMELGRSFIAFDLKQLQIELPRLFDRLEITKNSRIAVKDNTVTVDIMNNAFYDLCEEAGKQRRLHEAMGSPFSSAIGCASAKAAGKPIIIDNEEQIQTGTTKIQYRILEE